ncbi:MAG TPA: hypothetical protein VMN56_01290 [Casimicrobiaceae bacterium]|nr:hypothetical protein [Casimicrobiaceae bacterium]
MSRLYKRYGRAGVECQRNCRERHIDPAKVARAKIRRHGTAGGAQVWIIDGGYVRSAFDIEFALGSHDAHSKFIPPGEIWVEDLAPADLRALIAHEGHERQLMLKGATYAKAHASANRVEAKLRRK